MFLLSLFEQKHVKKVRCMNQGFVGKRDRKVLAKRTGKSTQVNARVQNQNLRTDLRRVAKRIHKSARKSQKAVNFTHIIG